MKKLFKIESGIPIKSLPKPKKVKEKKKRVVKFDYPFAEMNVGDSFLVPCKNNNYKAVAPGWGGWFIQYKNSTAKKIRNEAYKFIKYMKKSSINKAITYTFSIRRAEGGFRCWRTR